MQFVYPIIVLGILALLFGVALAFFGKKLAVKTDPKEEKTKDLLAGANCGACGFAGCEGFAKALVEGKAALSACSVTSKANKDQIAAILGVEAKSEDSRVFVCCGGGERCKDRYLYNGLADCRSAAAVAGGNKACRFGCMGFGNCAKVCPVSAIRIEDGVAKIDAELCIRCGKCIQECPRGLIRKLPMDAPVAVACRNRDKGAAVKKICKTGCIGCGICEKNCPHGAITLVDNLPIINYAFCTGCGTCAEKCPCKTILKI